MKPIFAKPYEPSPEDADSLRRLDLLEDLEGMGRKRTVKIELMQAEERLLRNIFLYAYDWRQTFGIRQLPPAKGKKGSATTIRVPKDRGKNLFGDELPDEEVEIKTHHMVPGAAERWQVFQNILYYLNERVLTGDKAFNALSRLFKKCSELEVKWYKRVVKRDLRIGVSRKTIEKCYPGLIPEWYVQVAGKIDSIEDAKYLDYPRYADVKLDGIRLTVVVPDDGSRPSARTRSGMEYPQLTEIVAECASMGPGYYDGEVFAGRWNATSSIMRLDPESDEAKRRIPKLTFQWFDLYLPRRPKLTFEQRRVEMLRRSYRRNTGDLGRMKRVTVVPATLVHNADEVKVAYMAAINAGHEGVMLKRPDGLWRPTDKRDDTWIKVKPFVTVDAEITGYYEGRGKNKGKLGGFVVEYKGKELGVGGGYSDALREKLWRDTDRYIGKVIEFKIQDDPNEVALGRFVVFKRFREDKAS